MMQALVAGGWGLLAGSALLLGAAVGWFTKLPQRVVAGVMAFGSGVLISALSFELMDEAEAHGGLAATALGFVVGAALFTGANLLIAWRGGKHRKHADGRAKDGGNPTALAIGALLDGIPESIVVGVSLLGGGGVSLVAVAAVFLSNIPEGLSSAAGMKAAGRSFTHVALLWGGIALASGVSAMVGYLAFDNAPPETIAFVQALAAGAILAMIIDTMAPEAFEGAHNAAGFIAVAGFLAAFALSKAA
ncbi:ZIP family metal transporter [Glacieibacterium frigidum]|uniref:ZIP family zinc transporter n=1 Tax=Glacieibacterium frigidum TaxID=2593303 RepID=A0A552UJD8_9SPHN|nr:ZIP family zinc transporter [Glacieibacterium frigidum]TRW18281.1 ZIP family zinc transporter [Glacieibacterium frigidum]